MHGGTEAKDTFCMCNEWSCNLSLSGHITADFHLGDAKLRYQQNDRITSIQVFWRQTKLMEIHNSFAESKEILLADSF